MMGVKFKPMQSIGDYYLNKTDAQLNFVNIFCWREHYFSVWWNTESTFAGLSCVYTHIFASMVMNTYFVLFSIF